MQTEVKLGVVGELSRQLTREAMWMFDNEASEGFVGVRGGGREKM
jgi:hypothetical protein